MTSISFCEKCNTLRFRLDDQNKVASEGEMGWKSSCCGTCSNPKCEDYGECDCFDSRIEQMTDLLKQRLEEGWVPDDVGIFD